MKTKVNIKCFLYSLISSIALFLSMKMVSYKAIKELLLCEKVSAFMRLIYDIGLSLTGFSIKGLIVMVALFFLFKKSTQIRDKKITRMVIVPAILFAVFMVLGYSFKTTASWNLVLGSSRSMVKALIKCAGLYILFNAVLKVAFDYLTKNEITDNVIEATKKINIKYVLIIAGLILLMWLPYEVASFPGLTNYDFFDELDSYYGNDTYSLRAVTLIDPDVTLNNNNPVLQTLMGVGAMKIGNFLGSPYIGLALFCYLQAIAFALVLAYSIAFMKKHNIKKGIRIAVLLFYGLVPIHANFAMSTLKDTNFSFVTLLYIICLIELIIEHKKFCESKGKLIYFMAVSLLMMLLRNNGSYLCIFTAVAILIVYRKSSKKLLVSVFVPIIVFMCITKIAYPALSIAEGSRREMLSIPFQQTARLIKYCDKDISYEDAITIDKVLDYDTIAGRYDPELSDAVKATFRKDCTSEELREYFKVWAKGLKQHPGLYVQATMNNYYGYFYPEVKHWLVYTNIAESGKPYGLESPKALESLRCEVNNLAYAFQNIPGLGLLLSPAMYTWALILAFFYTLFNMKKKFIIALLPLIVVLLTTIAGPANTMLRYVYPMIIAMPLLLTMCIAYKGGKDSSGNE